jgi:hypothetical protein
MTLEIHYWKLHIKQQLKDVKNKNIKILFANDDGIVHVPKAIKFIDENLKPNNNVEINNFDVEHREILDEGSPIYDYFRKELSK